jgi:Flp pilus assembly protein TadD
VSRTSAGKAGAVVEEYRVTNPAIAHPGAPAAAPVPNDAWYLHGQGRRFGPLTEDDMRGYFRAGMVKGNDLVAILGQVGTVSATVAATHLGAPAPAPASTQGTPAASAPAAIVVTQTGTRTSGVLVALGLFVAVVGVAYFKLHVPAGAADASAEVASVPASNTAQARPGAQVQAADWQPNSPLSLLGSPQATPSAAEATPPPVPEAAAAVATNPAMQAATTDGPRAATIDWAKDARALWGNWSSLLAHAQKWTGAEPRNAWAWWYLGVARGNVGDQGGAITDFQQGLAVDPGHFRLRWALANGYAAQHRHRESTQLLQALIREQPGEAGLWSDLGYDWAQLGEYDETVAALEKAVQLDPKNRRAWSNLAWAYAKFGYKDRSQDATARANAHL